MIQIYSPNNTDFTQNGDMTLFPESCKATSELGGAWILEITHPIDDEGRWKYIEKEAVLSVPTFMGKNQLYRIDEITDKNDTEISALAYPIFFDSTDEVFHMDVRPTGKNGQEALDVLTAGTKYSGESDISTVNTAYFVRRNLMDCISGDDSPSFLGTWGGEPLYDNHKIIVNERAGGDHGAEVRCGKNISGVSIKEDMSEVVTRIVPVAYNGRTLSTNWVDSPLIGNYVKIYTREIKFEDVKFHEDVSDSEDTTGLIVCYSQAELDAALIEKCNEQFESGVDLFKVTIDVDLVALENTEEYKDFKDLVKIGLGDDVSCYHSRLGIETKARAIKIVWDCITDSVEEVKLGDYEHDFLNDWSSTISNVESILNNDGSVVAEKIQGLIDGVKAQLKVQSTAAQKQEVRAILFEDLDPDSELYGALAIGTQGVQISKIRTADGRDWNWTTALTANGLIADVIVSGLLSDKTGKNWWNLNTGEFVMKNGSIEINGSVRKNASDYTEEDLDIANSCTIGLTAITPELLDRYDIDGDGEITVLDVLKINRMLTGQVDYYDIDTSVKISPLLSQQILKTAGVSVGTNGLYANSISGKNGKFDRLRIYAPDYSPNGYAYGQTGEFYASGKHIRVDGGIITRVFGDDATYIDSDNWKYRQLGKDGVYEVLYFGAINRGVMSEYGSLYYAPFDLNCPLAISELYEFNANVYHESGLMGVQLQSWSSTSFSFYLYSAKTENYGEELSFRAIIKKG